MDMTDTARVAHEAIRAVQAAQGDPCPASPWDALDTEERAVTITGVARVIAGATPEQNHLGWVADMLARGWRPGPVKDSVARTHPCLVPWAQLPEAQRVKDRLFAAVTAALAG